MKRLIFSCLISCAVLPVLMPQAQAQVTLRCGTGMVDTAGFHINNLGEVVFAEPTIACGVVEGPAFPPALELAIVSPPVSQVINVSSQSVPVAFAGTVTNYSAAFDSCQVAVTPSIPGSPFALVPNNGQVAATLTFPQGQSPGTYNIALSCTRTANGQQVVVNNPAPRSITVQGGGSVPAQCSSQPIASVFSPVYHRNYTDTYSSTGGWGAEPNVATVWRNWYLTRNPSGGGTPLTATELRTWKFRPNENARMWINKGGHGGAQYMMSISECPGQFAEANTVCSTQTSLVWRTGATGSGTDCVLDPTKDYYLNLAVFDRTHFLSTGQYRSTITCGSSCDIQLNVQKIY